MPNVASLLKQEITRLARKEVRAAVDPLKKQGAALRHEVAALKREQASLKRQVAILSKASKASFEREDEGSSPGRERISAKGIRSMRSKLGLSAADLGTLVGASAQSVYAWEKGVAPRGAPRAKLIALRGKGKKEVKLLLAEVAPAARRAPAETR